MTKDMSYRFSLHFLIQFDWFYIISTDRGLPEMAKQFLTTHSLRPLEDTAPKRSGW